MSPRRALTLVGIPLAVSGSANAHMLAYRLVEPDPLAREQLLAGTGHGYLAAAPLVLGIAAAMLLAGLAARTVEVIRGRQAARVSPWPFLALPPLGFLLQESLERLLVGNGGSLLGATLGVGLALQLPFGALAYLVARMLLRAADELGLAIACSRHLSCGRRLAEGRLLVAGICPQPRPGRLGTAPRGPPVVHAS